jgi:hypothetical protein
VDQLKRLGHSVDKASVLMPGSEPTSCRLLSEGMTFSPGAVQVEFIVMGGTFMSLDEDYKDWFIRHLHDALSGHSSNR